MAPLDTTKLYFELSNQRNLDAIDSLFHEEAIYNSANTGLFFGKKSILTMMRGFFEKFPLLNWDILSCEEVGGDIFEIHFELTQEDHQGNETKKCGIERIIVKDGYLRYVEVRNI